MSPTTCGRYGNSPIADQAAEAVGLPAIEGGSDDGNVSRVGVEIAAKIRNERLSIVETAIPGEDKASMGAIRLFFAP